MLQEQSGEVWGRAPSYGVQPEVKAYRGQLPSEARGIEFETDVPPDSPYGPIATWRGPRDGVRVEGEFAKIRVTIVRNAQA